MARAAGCENWNFSQKHFTSRLYPGLLEEIPGFGVFPGALENFAGHERYGTNADPPYSKIPLAATAPNDLLACFGKFAPQNQPALEQSKICAAICMVPPLGDTRTYDNGNLLLFAVFPDILIDDAHAYSTR